MEQKFKNVFYAKDRECWRYSFQFKGRTYRRGGFPTEEQAGLAALNHKTRIQEEFRMAGRIGTTFYDISIKYLDSLKKSETPIKKDGINNKAKAVADFLWFMKNPNLEINEISFEDIKAYLLTRPTKDSFNRYRTALSQVFEYAISELRIVNYNPVSEIKKQKVRRKKRTIPTMREVLLLLKAAGDDFPGPKSRYKKVRCDERDLLLVIIHSMARYGEILNLKWDDIKWGSRILVKRTHKTEDQSEKEIPVPINDDLLWILQRRFEERQQDEWVFWNHQTKQPYDRRPKLMKALCKKSQIRDISFHGLRHFVTTMLSNTPNVPIAAVQQLLGHEDIKTTQNYIHAIDERHRYTAKILEGEFKIIQ